MILELDEPITQEQFGEIVGVSRQAVSALVQAGGLPAKATAREWLRAYCYRMREQAAGRQSDGELDLVQERAALARSQRMAVDIKNAISRGEYAPIGLLGDVLANASAAVADRFDGLEALLQKIAPDLEIERRDAIIRMVNESRNEWARSTQQLVSEMLDAMTEDGGEAVEA